jgi:hypothetical protein
MTLTQIKKMVMGSKGNGFFRQLGMGTGRFNDGGDGNDKA